MGASLILEKLFGKSSLYDIGGFSILASGPRLDATITSKNILRRSSIDNVLDHLYDASLVLEDFSSRSRIPPIIPFILIFFRIVHYEKLFRRSSDKYRTFLGVQPEVIYFCYVVRKNEKRTR